MLGFSVLNAGDHMCKGVSVPGGAPVGLKPSQSSASVPASGPGSPRASRCVRKQLSESLPVGVSVQVPRTRGIHRFRPYLKRGPVASSLQNRDNESCLHWQPRCRSGRAGKSLEASGEAPGTEAEHALGAMLRLL